MFTVQQTVISLRVAVTVSRRRAAHILRRDEVGNGLPDDLLASKATQAAAGVVHVGVTTVQIRHDDSVRSLLDETTGSHVARLERFVCAIERHRDESEYAHTSRCQCGGQHGDDDRLSSMHGRGELHHNQSKQHRREASAVGGDGRPGSVRCPGQAAADRCAD